VKLSVMPGDNALSPLPLARPICLVVDPHPALVELVGARLEQAGFDVVARVTSAEAAIDAAVATALRSKLID
jgi:CheY-like chemotaxis protein